ncbi:MAG: DUF3078 domain-containing protein [Chlorobi bacterium]|nr:DUF3078 domain-containing protein [Chlorobiota bacterium]
MTAGVFKLSAQNPADTVKYWTNQITPALNFNQVSLTNWSAGGDNSVSGTIYFKGVFKYKKNKTAWDNLIDVGYGMTKQGDQNLYKTEDKLNLASMIGVEAGGGKWYYTGMVDFKTTMAVGYNDPVNKTGKLSEFMSPGYLNFSIGMNYKPNDNFSLYLSPLSTKMTIVLDDSLSNAGAFGVDPGDKLRAEYGAKLELLAKKDDVIKNVGVSTRLGLFSNLTNNPQNVDVNWDFNMKFKVNDWLAATFTLNMIFDDDIKYVEPDGTVSGARVQLKQIFGFGLNYTFHN